MFFADVYPTMSVKVDTFSSDNNDVAVEGVLSPREVWRWPWRRAAPGRGVS